MLCINKRLYRTDRTHGATGATGATGAAGSTGATGATSGLAAYGGLYQTGAQLPAFTSANSYMQLGLNTTLPSQNVTPNANNTLTVQQNGTYEIHYNVLLSTNKSVDIGIGIRQNGAILPNTRSSQTLAKDSSPGSSYNASYPGPFMSPCSKTISSI